MVEVFKTNVHKKKQSWWLLKLLRANFPAHKINFDLSDCDKVLRVEGTEVQPREIIGLVKENGYQCQALE